MIGKESTDNFIAETEMEESLMLIGKVNALRGIYTAMPSVIDAKIVNAIFGFETEEPEEVKNLRIDLDMYKNWYHQEMCRANKLLKEKNDLERKLAEKEEDYGNTV